MKLFLLVLLSVLAAASTASVEPVGIRANLILGNIATGDRLLNRSYLNRQRIANTVQSQDLIYRGNATTRITSIRAIEIGVTQYAIPRVISGGIGQNNVTLRIQSARGYGFNYSVEIWGR